MGILLENEETVAVTWWDERQGSSPMSAENAMLALKGMAGWRELRFVKEIGISLYKSLLSLLRAIVLSTVIATTMGLDISSLMYVNVKFD